MSLAELPGTVSAVVSKLLPVLLCLLCSLVLTPYPDDVGCGVSLYVVVSLASDRAYQLPLPWLWPYAGVNVSSIIKEKNKNK